jgi:hypothetical protein
MKYAKGNWRVVRNCCLSSGCTDCMRERTRPVRVVQGAGYSQEWAELVARNFRAYVARAEPMEEVKQVA